MQSPLGTISNSSDKCCFFLPDIREGNTFTKGNFCPPFRQMKESKELFLYLLFLNCLQLKIILMLKWHILGWHILIPFTPLLFSMLKLFHLWPVGATSSWFLSPLKQPSSLNSLLDLWFDRGSRLLSYFPCVRPRMSHFSKEHWLLLGANGIWKPKSGHSKYM